LILERYNGGDSGSSPMAFNEYSDLTEEEYLRGERMIRKAYNEWCAYYGKTSDDPSRYRTFSNHFRVVKRHAEETGASLMLNEYADMVEDDYNALTKTNNNENHSCDGSRSSTEKDRDKNDPVVERRIVDAYQEFCRYYKKTADEIRLNVFAAHFLVVERYHETTGESIALNQYADMTEEEVRKVKKT